MANIARKKTPLGGRSGNDEQNTRYTRPSRTGHREARFGVRKKQVFKHTQHRSGSKKVSKPARKYKKTYRTAPVIPSFAFTEEEMIVLKDTEGLDVEVIDSKFQIIESLMRQFVECTTQFYRSKRITYIPTLCDSVSRLEREMKELRNMTTLPMDSELARMKFSLLEEGVKDVNDDLNGFERKYKSIETKQDVDVEKTLESWYCDVVKRMIKRDLQREAHFLPFLLKEEGDLFRTPQESYDELTEEFKGMSHLMGEATGTVTVVRKHGNRIHLPCNPLNEPKFEKITNPEEIFFPRLSVDDEGRVAIFRMTAKPLKCDLSLHLENVKKEGKVPVRSKNLLYELSMLELQVSSIKKYEKIECVVLVFEDFGLGKDSSTMRKRFLEDFIAKFGTIFKNLMRLLKDGKFFWYPGYELERLPLCMKRRF